MEMTPKTEIPLKGCAVDTTRENPLKIVASSVTDNLEKYEGDVMIFLLMSDESSKDCNGKSDSKQSSCMADLKNKYLQEYDAKFAGGLLEKTMESRSYGNKLGKSLCLRIGDPKTNKVEYISCVGMGDTKSFKTSDASKVSSEIARIIESNKFKEAAIVLDERLSCENIQALVENIILSMSPDDRFKSSENEKLKSSKKLLKKLTLLSFLATDTISECIKRAEILASATFFAVELTNAPANICTTLSLSEAAASMAKQFGLKCTIMDEHEIEKMNMGCYLGVASGSKYPPRLIHLVYTPDSSPIKKRVALIGKGICFDSGGYNIKIMSSQIELMKFDMGGAAAILGAARAIGTFKPKNIEVHFIIASAENMVSQNAYRPGDILVASNGKTVEIGNTDAEGRLTLADALVFANKCNADVAIDVATLCGATVVALGEECAALFSSDDDLAEDLLKSSKSCGEFIWRMPLVQEYREFLDSKIADLNNVASSSGRGGAITAALFLKEFVKNMKWAHIDIAGTAWNSKDGCATGFGVRTLTKYILSTAMKS